VRRANAHSIVTHSIVSLRYNTSAELPVSTKKDPGGFNPIHAATIKQSIIMWPLDAFAVVFSEKN